MTLRLVIGSDDAGFDYKEAIKADLAADERISSVTDVGVDADSHTFYPSIATTAADIVETARAHLASYQKPRSVEFVAELPKAPTGKILKRELRAPYWDDRSRSV